MNFDDIKIFYKPYPYLIINNFLSEEYSSKLKKDILEFNNFDDKVMVNRSRINKGSKNFANILSTSEHINKFYNTLNSMEMFHKFYNLFNLENSNWKVNEKLQYFSKNYFGKQKDDFYENFIKFLTSKNILKTKINLDIDFSVSGKGYNRGPHRDRETRVLNFLIYLNDFDKQDGGDFQIFDYETKESNNQSDYPRFPNIDLVSSSYSVQPKKGKLVVFLSTPNSYHAAGEFLVTERKRVFIYGSYSLNKKVNWTTSKQN